MEEAMEAKARKRGSREDGRHGEGRGSDGRELDGRREETNLFVVGRSHGKGNADSKGKEGRVLRWRGRVLRLTPLN